MKKIPKQHNIDSFGKNLNDDPRFKKVGIESVRAYGENGVYSIALSTFVTSAGTTTISNYIYSDIKAKNSEEAYNKFLSEKFGIK